MQTSQSEISVLNPCQTSLYAAAELARCLRQMSDPPVHLSVRVSDEFSAGGITLALAGDARLKDQKIEIAESPEDDEVFIQVSNGAGFIVGSNPRSLLVAVYRFLHHLGCRWVRPGADGELLPRCDIRRATVNVTERASLRHRIVCIEGAVSLQHVLDMIDWCPKVGFNGYFMQFADGYTFFNRWYSHAGNPDRESEPFSVETARAFTIRIESELTQRSMRYHAVGHGWTCAALGTQLSHWDPVSLPLTPQARGMIAQVQGQRALQWDRPMLTSLCFSQPLVRQQMIAAIVKHSLENPAIDLLHVWIDDGGNNKCECDDCSKLLPSDYYVRMLHELDEALTAVASAMRIAFIAYSDLLWPPRDGTAPLNPQRFVFLYANSRRSYREVLASEGDRVIPEYVRNKTSDLSHPDRFRGFLSGWKKFFPDGEAILFEYHLWSDQGGIHNQYDLARVIHSDIAHLKQLGFNGLISCQPQRIFFPTGLPCYLMGQSLWKCDEDLDALRDDYFHASFGQDGGACKEFIKVSSETLNSAVRFENQIVLPPDAMVHLLKLEQLIIEFERVIARHQSEPILCHAQSWIFIAWYARLLHQLLGLFRAMAQRDQQDVLDQWQQMRAFASDCETQCHAAFDTWAFLRPMDAYIINGRFSSNPQDIGKQACTD